MLPPPCRGFELAGAPPARLRCIKREDTWASSCAVSGSFGQTGGLSTSACKGTIVMGRIQPTCVAHPRVVLPENSTIAHERFDIDHSILHMSVPLVREPDSPRLLPTSPAVAGAGGTGWCHQLKSVKLQTVACIALSGHCSRSVVPYDRSPEEP
jgi:hypothetical protein